MNFHAVKAIYRFEMARTFRTLMQSIASPVLTTSLYFVVFGAAIGSRMGQIDGVSYGAFIIPGLVMLSLLTESLSNASFGIYMPKWSGTIYELLSAPVSFVEVLLGYVGAAASKSVILGILILLTARLFVPYEIAHPLWMAFFLVLTAITFSLFGFIIGIWADSFEKLQVIPLMVVTPLTFLGGAFYSISMLPPVWQKITLLNPVVYLISAFRWSFYGVSDVNVAERGDDRGIPADQPGNRVDCFPHRLAPEGLSLHERRLPSGRGLLVLGRAVGVAVVLRKLQRVLLDCVEPVVEACLEPQRRGPVARLENGIDCQVIAHRISLHRTAQSSDVVRTAVSPRAGRRKTNLVTPGCSQVGACGEARAEPV
jgi:ABC-2 type transport system permease protein